METIALVLMCLACFLVGMGAGCGIIWRPPSGTLRIDTSDPDDKPNLFLELNRDVGDIGEMETLVLNVSTENYLPHE